MTEFQRSIVMAIGHNHFSPKELGPILGKPASAIGRAMHSMARQCPQIMRFSGSVDDVPKPQHPTELPWDGMGDARMQLTAHGLSLLAQKPKLEIVGG